jgi:predicted ATP-dependent Lon-type protease
VPLLQIVNAGYNKQELQAAGIIQNFFTRNWSIVTGGKSGSGITRKRRLRLKKSRSVTRHKGGKKSVRFSTRVMLNNGNGNGNGNGKGSSSMNKKTRKVSSNSYKLNAHRVIKLKR